MNMVTFRAVTKVKWGPGFRAQSIALRGSAASNYSYLAGTAANLNPAIDVRSTQTAQPNHKYRIKIDSTINGQAWVSVERDVRDGRGYQALVSALMQGQKLARVRYLKIFICHSRVLLGEQITTMKSITSKCAP